MDEMTEKQEDATRIIEAIGTTILNECYVPVINWVAVEEKMPESGQCVLLYSKDGGVAEGAYLSSKGHFEQWRWNAILTNVSHWMPIPEPPCL